MIQSNNETYSAVNLDEAGKFLNFGVFEVKTLNELLINHTDQPGITEPTFGTQAIPGYTKLVGDVDGINTQITQNETDINLLATDVSGNTSQININSSSISSLVNDVSGNSTQITQNATSISSLATDVNSNYSLISQNASEIALRVTTADFNSQVSITEGKIAMKVGDSANVKAQIVVDAVNGGSVNIAGERVNITGNATFSSTQSTANTANATAQQAQTAVNQANTNHTTLVTSLGDLAYDDLVETAQLGNTIISGGYIKTNLLTANNIVAGTFTGLTFRTSATGRRIEVQNSNNRLSVFDNANNNVLNIGYDAQNDSTNNLIYARDINNGTGPIAFFEGWRDSNVLRVNGYTDSNFPTIYVDSTNNDRTCMTLSNRGNGYACLRLVSGLAGEAIDFDGIWLQRIGNDLYWDGQQIN